LLRVAHTLEQRPDSRANALRAHSNAPAAGSASRPRAAGPIGYSRL